MYHFAIGNIVVYYTTIIQDKLNKMADNIKFKVVKN